MHKFFYIEAYESNFNGIAIFADIVDKERLWEPLVEKDETLENGDDTDEADVSDENENEEKEHPMVSIKTFIHDWWNTTHRQVTILLFTNICRYIHDAFN